MATRTDFKRVRKAVIRGEELDPADVELARRWLKSRAVYGRQRLVIDVGLLLVCAGCVIALAALRDTRPGDFALPALAALFGVPAPLRHYRIRRWCDRHPDIAYTLYDPREPEQGAP